MLGGGGDQSWLEPLDDRGQRPSDGLEETVGQHSGGFSILNVRNPQPGFQYSWARNTDQDRTLVKIRGGQIVQAGDPDSMNSTLDNSSLTATPVDSANTFAELVLVRTPDERRDMELTENQRRARSQLRNAGSEFIDGATGVERDPSYSGGAPTRFMTNKHMLTFENESGHTIDQWTPDSGIVRERKTDY